MAAETRTRPLRPSAGDQLLHLAFPFNLYDQTPFLGHGVSALTITSAGDRPPDPATDTVDALDADKLGLLGRSAQALVQSLDGAAEVARGTDSYLAIGGRLIRGFAIEFVLLVALLPPALATVDFAVRMLRRGISFAPAWRSLRSRLIVWLFAGGVAALFAFMGLFPRGDERPIALDSPLADDWPLGAIVGLLAISTIAWFAARVRLVPRGRVAREDELGAHAVMMLTLLAVSAVLAVWNPYSLLLVLPSLHAWLWLPHLLDRPVLLRAVTYAVGFVPLVGLFVSFALRYELGFDAVWYVATLFSIGYASPVLYVTFLVWAAAAGLAGAIAFGRYGPYPAPETLARADPAHDRPSRRPATACPSRVGGPGRRSPPGGRLRHGGSRRGGRSSRPRRSCVTPDARRSCAQLPVRAVPVPAAAHVLVPLGVPGHVARRALRPGRQEVGRQRPTEP